MKKAFLSPRRILAVIFLLALGLGASLLNQTYYDSHITDEFYRELKDSNQSVLDLRKFNAVEWDELAFWSPYQDICALGIEGFPKGSALCTTTVDDSDCYLLFLNHNKLQQKIKIDRKQLDLANSEIQWRIPKDKALFEFATKGEWPKVTVKTNP